MKRAIVAGLLSFLGATACNDLFGDPEEGSTCDRYCAKLESCAPEICGQNESCRRSLSCSEDERGACLRAIGQGDVESVECVLASDCDDLESC
jgi:hypothetical protein